MNARLLLVAVAALALTRCDCGGGTQSVDPIVAVRPLSVDFGKVKVGLADELTVTVESQAQSAVVIESASLLDGGGVPGGASDFELVDVPSSVGGFSEATFRIRFRPTVLQAYAAKIVLETNDPDRRTVEIPVVGEGAHPVLEVTAECLASKKCKGTATNDPPAIDYGAEPFRRAVEISPAELPTVTLLNASEVTLALTKLAFEGDGAAAFVTSNDLTLTDTLPNGQPAKLVGPGEGLNIRIRFKPTERTIESYAAELVIQSDDPTHPEVRVALQGTLAPNQAPQVCANITSVKNPDSAEVQYSSNAHWEPLLVPPPTGYDFSATREIEPGRFTTVRFSALSNSADVRTCTTDVEDGRNLTYRWTAVQLPPGGENVGINGANTATPSLIPVATGVYDLLLTVTDAEGLATAVPIRFTAVLKKDIVVQLSWGGTTNASAGVDLDLHFVRPTSSTPGDDFSGAFSFFEGTSTTSGDLNGYANFRCCRTGAEWEARAYNFNGGLGGAGSGDDPKLHVDDIGGGPFIETISINDPENDAKCATAACNYKVLVHYFSDTRTHTGAPSCSVSGCLEGQTCNCTGQGERCVAASAPAATSPSGPGNCHVAPKPEIRVFLKASPTAAAVIPLPPDELALGAPCHLVYVADVVWPARNAPAGTEPSVAVRADPTGQFPLTRFGTRAFGSLRCTENTQVNAGPFGTEDWFSEEPL